jgi:hypothetical protein
MWKSIIRAGLIAGLLDIAAASIQAYLIRGTTPGQILQFIASGFFGSSAYEGGMVMMMWGLFFHFVIAMSCAICFFILFKPLHLEKLAWWLNAILIGLVAWLVTNLIVLPYSQIGSRPFVLHQVLIAVVILIVCIGGPLSLIAKNHFIHNRE